MTPYERCIAAIEGGTPDRVPAYTPSIACDVASKIVGHEVHTGSPSLWFAKAKASIAGDAAVAEFDQKHEEDLLELNRVFGQEVFRYPWCVTINPSAQLDEHTFLCGDPDGVHQIWRWDDQVMNFLKTKDTTPQRKPEDWPRMAREREKTVERSAQSAREGAGLREAELQKRLGDEMLVVAGGGGLSIGADEAGLMACVLEPAAVGDLLDYQLEVAIARTEGLAERGIRAALGGGDMADKNGPIYSPQVFRELMLPRLKRLAARCNELGVHYVWRTDGNLWPVTGMIFDEADVPGYGEVDYNATMTLSRIRERYPHLVCWANVSGDVLRRCSRDEVYDHCLSILEASEGTRYFHGCSNTILPGTPIENAWAMMEARDAFAKRQ